MVFFAGHGRTRCEDEAVTPEPGQWAAKCDQLARLMHRLFIIAGRTPSPLGAPSVEIIVNDTSSVCTPLPQPSSPRGDVVYIKPVAFSPDNSFLLLFTNTHMNPPCHGNTTDTTTTP